MTFLTTKNPTQWVNPSGQGFLANVGNLQFVTNLGAFIVDNTASHHQLVTTPIQSTPKNLTAWSSTGV